MEGLGSFQNLQNIQKQAFGHIQTLLLTFIFIVPVKLYQRETSFQSVAQRRHTCCLLNRVNPPQSHLSLSTRRFFSHPSSCVDFLFEPYFTRFVAWDLIFWASTNREKVSRVAYRDQLTRCPPLRHFWTNATETVKFFLFKQRLFGSTLQIIQRVDQGPTCQILKVSITCKRGLTPRA